MIYDTLLGFRAFSSDLSVSVGESYSFAIFGFSVGFCELQMCMAFVLAVTNLQSIRISHLEEITSPILLVLF